MRQNWSSILPPIDLFVFVAARLNLVPEGFELERI